MGKARTDEVVQGGVTRSPNRHENSAGGTRSAICPCLFPRERQGRQVVPIYQGSHII